MAGSFNRRKTVKKSEHWSKHGKSKARIVRAVEFNRFREERERIKRARAEPMYPTIQEAMKAAHEQMLNRRPRKVDIGISAAAVTRTDTPLGEELRVRSRR